MHKVKIAVIIAAVIIFPIVLSHNNYLIHIGTMVGIYAIAAIGFNILSGYTGLLSLGHAAFIGLGAYVSSIMAVNGSAPFLVCLPLAMVAAGVVGLLLGLISLRITDIYLKIVTLSFGFIMSLLFINLEGITGGATGMGKIPRPVLFGYQFTSSIAYYYLVVVVCTLVILFSWRLVHSPFGRSFTAVKENIVAAEAFGINSTRIKLLSFVISAVLAGMSGSLYAHYIRYISPDAFSFSNSLDLLIMIVIGGQGSIAGSVVGAAVVYSLPEMLRFAAVYYYAIFGLIIIVVMVFIPGGLASLPHFIQAKWTAKIAPKKNDA